MVQTKKDANNGGDATERTLHIQHNTVDAPAHQTVGTDYTGNVHSAARDMVLSTDVDEDELRRRISLIIASGS